jgi:hypothetical protein
MALEVPYAQREWVNWELVERMQRSPIHWPPLWAALNVPPERLSALEFQPWCRRVACALCSALEQTLVDVASREALGVIGRFALGEATMDELVKARDSAKLAARRLRRRRAGRPSESAAAAVRDAGRNNAIESLILASQHARDAGLDVRRQAEILITVP